MAVTASSLKTNHYEFNDVLDATVTDRIAKATRHCNSTTFGDQLDDAVELWACHLLASDHFGSNLALDDDGDADLYYRKWKELARPLGRAIWSLSS